jgi:hypothetical protein
MKTQRIISFVDLMRKNKIRGKKHLIIFFIFMKAGETETLSSAHGKRVNMIFQD